MNRKIVELTDNNLAKLAEDKRNIVYRFGDRDRLPDDEVVPVEQVRDNILQLYKEYCQERMLYIDSKRAVTRPRWEAIKKKLLAKPKWQRFDHTHPLIVDRVLHLETGPKEIKALMFMIFLKENGGDLETLKEYIFREFSMTKEEYDKKFGNS